jgi:hypothetical protein
MSETICLRGLLRKGNPCWMLRDEASGETYALIGDLAKVRDGDVVYVCGTMASQQFCGSSAALVVSYIGGDIGGLEKLPSAVERTVRVRATLSSRDYSPRFRLEGVALPLSADGTRWIGEFENIQVQGKLDVFFESDGWKNQPFSVSVDAADPADSSKTWTKEFKATATKGHVAINETLDVGAA